MDAVGRLVSLFHRRWNAPILAELRRDGGAKFITLSVRLGASEGAVRSSLDDLIAKGWVIRNPGYGHPLRPEYILTEEGERLADPCTEVLARLRSDDLRECALRRWTMPALYVVGSAADRGDGARFGEVAEGLGGAGVITDRALSIALRALTGVDLVRRRVVDAAPPLAVYAASPPGKRIASLLGGLA